MVTGRTTEVRTISSLTKTSGSAAVTAAAGTFNHGDAGRPISGTGIPAGATILSVTSGTAATLSANATATNTAAATVGSAATLSAAAQTAGFFGWSPESDAEADSYSVAATNAGTVPPDRITDTTTNVSSKQRTRT